MTDEEKEIVYEDFEYIMAYAKGLHDKNSRDHAIGCLEDRITEIEMGEWDD